MDENELRRWARKTGFVLSGSERRECRNTLPAVKVRSTPVIDNFIDANYKWSITRLF